jgi:hypothetical protein
MAGEAVAGERDAFGNILCADHGPDPAPLGHHGGGMGGDCCLFGCGGGPAIVPVKAGLDPLPAAFVLASDRKRPVDAPVWRCEVQALSSRGPPA